MIGYITETHATVKKTIDLALELDLDWAIFTAVTPYPGTQLYSLARREGAIKSDYWREFTLGLKRDERIPYLLEDTNDLLKQAYRKFYFRPKYLFKQLCRTRSLYTLKKDFQILKGLFSFNISGEQ